MTDKSDKNWINDLAPCYRWPDPSHDLKQKIMRKVNNSNTHINNPTLIFFKWQSIMALAICMIMGASVQHVTQTTTVTSSQYENNIYSDEYLLFAQDIIHQSN